MTNLKATIIVYTTIAVMGIAIVFASWQVFIRTLPPIKVLIVGGCK